MPTKYGYKNNSSIKIDLNLLICKKFDQKRYKETLDMQTTNNFDICLCGSTSQRTIYSECPLKTVKYFINFN